MYSTLPTGFLGLLSSSASDDESDDEVEASDSDDSSESCDVSELSFSVSSVSVASFFWGTLRVANTILPCSPFTSFPRPAPTVNTIVYRRKVRALKIKKYFMHLVRCE